MSVSGWFIPWSMRIRHSSREPITFSGEREREKMGSGKHCEVPLGNSMRNIPSGGKGVGTLEKGGG